MKSFAKFRLFIFIVFISSIFSAIATPVSKEKAKSLAFNFIKNVDSRLTSDAMSLLYSKADAYYVFGNEYGWIIISADDRVIPVIAYSTENSFIVPENEADTICSNNFWGMMKNIEDQIRFVVDNNIPATSEIENQWKNLNGSTGNKSPATVVPPLLTTTWNQDWPYNAMCPADAWGPGGHVYAGCVATAMAQIMKYHNYPSQGLGSYGYTWQSYPYSGANFGTTTYNWVNMPNSISSVNTDVATIIYHAGVATRSMWGSSSTGVLFTSNDDPVTTGFINYFKMAFSSIKAVDKINYTDTDWHNLIQAELTANRPVYYRGDGSLSHAWVCDGVDASNMYHFNFGWGGMYNGYFALTNINPGTNNLTNNQAAIIGIKPNDGSTLVTNTTWSGTMTKTTNIAVPDAITLTVSPGAVISFGQDCKLQVWGKISSIGTSSNYAKLTASNQTNGWDGIDIDEDYLNRMSDNDTSKLIYTQIEWSKSSGIYCYQYGKLLVDHCKVNDNDGFNGAGICVNNHSIKISNSEIYNNHATNGGGGGYLNYTDNLSVNISQNDIHDNIALQGGGFWLFAYDNMSFEDNLIYNNQASSGAGGALGGGNPSIVNNKFCNNTTISSSGKGGGLYLENCNANVINNLFANNTRGGLCITTNSNPQMLNNTISYNSSPNYGGGIRIMYNSNPAFRNTILYGNSAPSGSQITLETTDCDPFFDHCNIEAGNTGFYGPGAGSNYTTANYTNNIDADPLFVAPSAGAGNGFNGLTANWQLQSSSPCVNAGDTTGVSQYLPTLDLAGNPRINGIIDMGAYEYGCTVPAQPSVITGNSNPCQASSQVYSVTNVAGVTYTWAVPSGSTITAGQGTNSITVTIGATSGNISVTPSNSCGNGTVRNLAITINTVPAQPSVITGSTNPCQTSSQVYSVTNVVGVTYTWTVPTGSTIVSGQGTNSISVTIGATSGNISVTPSNSCGNGTVRNLAITINTVPAQPSVITGSTNPCQASSQTYSVTNVSGVTYTWAVPTGSAIVSGQGSNSITVTIGTSGGNISVTPSNTCGNGTAQSIAVIVNPKPATPVITQNFNLLNSSSAVGNQWYNLNAGMINGAVSSSYQPQQNGIYYCIVSLSNCSSDTSNKINVVNVGIEEKSTVIEVQILPNPNNGSFTILNTEGINEIILTELSGKEVYRQLLNNENEHFVSVSLANGVYLFNMRKNKMLIHKKLIISNHY